MTEPAKTLSGAAAGPPADDPAPLGPVVRSAEQLRADVDRIAGEIVAARGARSGAPRTLTLCPVLTGAWFFASDLLRALDAAAGDAPGLLTRLEPIRARSRHGVRQVDLQTDLRLVDPDAIRGQDVLVVEDILDTGYTLARLMSELRSMGPASLQLAVLVVRDADRHADHAIEPDYEGFRVPPGQWVVGYGMDLEGLHRQHRAVFALDPHPLEAARRPGD